MHAERDHLAKVVFPDLEERLKPLRCRIEPIDLRVGVETNDAKTEQEREQQILKVCLQEIECSRPFLLVLLGDRYDWVPEESRIRAAAEEEGFETDARGKSVTALEIEYGLLKKDAKQRRRSLLYLRTPLPYEKMPRDVAAVYSDAHAGDALALERADHLAALKERILVSPGKAAPEKAPSLPGFTAALKAEPMYCCSLMRPVSPRIPLSCRQC